MAGSNNIPKYALCNREDELLEFKIRGPNYGQVDGLLISSATLTVGNLLAPFYFDATTPNAITGPTMAQLQNLFGQNYLTTPGSYMQFTVHNYDTVAKVITFPGIGSMTIPPQSFYTGGFVVLQNGNLGFYQPTTNISAVTDPFAAIGNGYIVKTGLGTYINRSIVGTAPVITTNQDGTAGNTLISLDTQLTNFDTYLSSGANGIMAKINTPTGTVVGRTIIGTSPILVTNGDGVLGNPVISLNAAAVVINASQVVVSPTVDGASNVQSALTNIAASVPVIPLGPGYIAENGAGTFFARTFAPGLNITISNPDGVAGNSTVAFSQSGTTEVVAEATGIRTFNAANDILFWSSSGSPQWEAQSLKAATTLLRMDDTFTSGCSFHGTSATSWDTNGRFFSIDMGTWGSTVQPFKNMAWIQTSETNTNAVVGGNNQGLADPKNIMLQFHQTGNSTLLAPALPLSGQLYKAFSLFTDTPGIATGDYTGEIAYLRGDGTFAGRAFNVVSNLDSKKNISSLEAHLFEKASALELVQKIQPISFNYKDEEDDHRQHFGFLVNQIDDASEKEEELKTLVSYSQDGSPATLNLSDAFALLFRAFQEYVQTHP